MNDDDVKWLVDSNDPSVLPCPFCGMNLLELHFWNDGMPNGQSTARIHCMPCHLDGPVAATSEEALYEWNTRLGVKQ